MSIRLDGDLADDLETVAAVDGKPMADVIRQAVADHVTARRADPGFKAALRVRMGKLRQLLGDDDG
jgi:predicted transcriptional regulator